MSDNCPYCPYCKDTGCKHCQPKKVPDTDEKECKACAGRGCYMCTTVQPVPNAEDINPVCKEIEVEKLERLLDLLHMIRTPRVNFVEDMSQMRSQANTVLSIHLQNAIVILTEMVEE